jgi:DNA-binding transcriptional MerR regulator
VTRPREPITFTLGQLGKRVGLARTSVLHYESLGLLVPRARSAAGYRLYGTDELERLRTIRRLRDAGLPLADIRNLLASRGGAAPGRGPQQPRAAELLEKRLLGLCEDVERIRRQQRLLARLLALPEFRGERLQFDKAEWVALLRRAGLDESAMHMWHVEFERESPREHAAFLRSLGLAQNEVDQVRRRARADCGSRG